MPGLFWKMSLVTTEELGTFVEGEKGKTPVRHERGEKSFNISITPSRLIRPLTQTLRGAVCGEKGKGWIGREKSS
jgi:hypothetical protein